MIENCIGDEGIEKLSEVLINNATLTRLILKKNDIGVKGIRMISRVLTSNTTLTELDMSCKWLKMMIENYKE